MGVRRLLPRRRGEPVLTYSPVLELAGGEQVAAAGTVRDQRVERRVGVTFPPGRLRTPRLGRLPGNLGGETLRDPLEPLLLPTLPPGLVPPRPRTGKAFLLLTGEGQPRVSLPGRLHNLPDPLPFPGGPGAGLPFEPCLPLLLPPPAGTLTRPLGRLGAPERRRTCRSRTGLSHPASPEGRRHPPLF